jgi:uncharacterized protein YwbE
MLIMKNKIIVSLLLGVFIVGKIHAQFVVSDPIHTGISIVSKILHVANQITATLELDEILKAAEKLRKVSNGIQTFHRVQLTIKNIQKAGKHYQESVNAIVTDKHFKPKEIEKILVGYETLLGESSSIIKDMNMATKGNFLDMKDGERLDWLNKVCDKANAHVSNIEKFTSSVRSISMLRSRNNNDYRITTAIYGFATEFRNELNASQYSVNTATNYSIDNGDAGWSGYSRKDVLNEAKGQTLSDDEASKQQMNSYQWGYGQLQNTTTSVERNTSGNIQQPVITRNTNGQPEQSYKSKNASDSSSTTATGCMKYDKTGPYWDPECKN